MRPAAGNAPPPTLRIMCASLRHDWRRAALAGCIVILAALIIAIAIRPTYRSTSTLLILLGSEYTYRPVAGETITVTSALDREQVLRTEAEILGVDDLHRQAIRDLTVARLYPDVLEPPGLLSIARGWAAAAIDGLRAAAGGEVTPKRPAEPVERALPLLQRRLTIQPVKAGNAIELSFDHPDPATAALLLTRLEHLYLALRRNLFLSQEADFVSRQVVARGAALAAADAALAQFKSEKGISNYGARREILLNQQGALETGLRTAGAEIAQQTARLAQLGEQARRVPREAMQSRDADVDQRLAPLRTTIESLRAREQEQRARYRDDSEVLGDTSRQLAALERELSRKRADQSPGAFRTGPNPLLIQVEQDRARAEVELHAARAHAAHDAEDLRVVMDGLVSLGRDEQQLEQLERARSTLDETYRAALKLRNERQVMETVQEGRQANVRIMQPPNVPEQPRPTRLLILLAGAVLGVLAAAGTALGLHYGRPVFLTPEALEAETGMAVLAHMPHAGVLAAHGFAVRPS